MVDESLLEGGIQRWLKPMPAAGCCVKDCGDPGLIPLSGPWTWPCLFTCAYHRVTRECYEVALQVWQSVRGYYDVSLA